MKKFKGVWNKSFGGWTFTNNYVDKVINKLKELYENIQIDIIEQKNNTKNKTCKKVSQTRCSPHMGEMDNECELSDKNRCIKKKISIKKKSLSKSVEKEISLSKFQKEELIKLFNIYWENNNFEYNSLLDLPPGILLTISNINNIIDKKDAINVLEPQHYNSISTLDINHSMFEFLDKDNEIDKFGYFRDGGDGIAVSGGGDDLWLKANEKLYNFLQNYISEKNGDQHFVNKKSSSQGKDIKQIHYLLEFKNDKSNKFYDIKLNNDNSVTIIWGKINTKGRKKILEFKNKEEAQNFIFKQIKEKKKKGYLEIKNNNSVDSEKLVSENGITDISDNLLIEMTPNFYDISEYVDAFGNNMKYPYNITLMGYISEDLQQINSKFNLNLSAQEIWDIGGGLFEDWRHPGVVVEKYKKETTDKILPGRSDIVKEDFIKDITSLYPIWVEGYTEYNNIEKRMDYILSQMPQLKDGDIVFTHDSYESRPEYSFYYVDNSDLKHTAEWFYGLNWVIEEGEYEDELKTKSRKEVLVEDFKSILPEKFRKFNYDPVFETIMVWDQDKKHRMFIDTWEYWKEKKIHNEPEPKIN